MIPLPSDDECWIEAPTLYACAQCWAPVSEHDTTCPHGHALDERRSWAPEAATFVVRHRALAGPLTGRFSYPVPAGRSMTFFVKMLESLHSLGLDLNELCTCGHAARHHDREGCGFCAQLTTDQHCGGYTPRPATTVFYVEPDPDVPEALLDRAQDR